MGAGVRQSWQHFGFGLHRGKAERTGGLLRERVVVSHPAFAVVLRTGPNLRVFQRDFLHDRFAKMHRIGLLPKVIVLPRQDYCARFPKINTLSGWIF